MKIKFYGWSTVDVAEDKKDGLSFYTIVFLPSFDIELLTSRHPKEEIKEWWDKDHDYQGKSLFIMFSWLLWGFTIDIRFGDDAGRE